MVMCHEQGKGSGSKKSGCAWTRSRQEKEEVDVMVKKGVKRAIGKRSRGTKKEKQRARWCSVSGLTIDDGWLEKCPLDGRFGSQLALG